MKVYVLELGNTYEESYIEGVFKYKETAESKGFVAKKRFGYDFYIVHEEEVIED